MTRRIIAGMLLFWGFCVGVSAQVAPAPKPTHALVTVAKIVTAPVAHPKRTLKDLFGSVLFATETGVDVVHGGLSLADKVFDVVSVQGKLPALDAVYGVVSIADTDTGKLDLWLERQEQFLFGRSN